MSTFGSGVFGGTGGVGAGGTGSAGVALSTILQPMLRIAGITTLPGTTPNGDQYGELVPMCNRMLQSWSLDGHKIFTSSSDEYALTSGQKIYSIGPGGDFDNGTLHARPQFIKLANILFPTTPVVRRGVRILDDAEWASVSIQDITGAPPFEMYYDGSMDVNGRGNISLRFQPTAGYILELYTWEALQSGFTSSEDIAVFPPGYEETLVWNGALRVAALYPLESKISPIAATMARDTLQAVRVLNMKSPKIGCEAALDRGGNGNDVRPWLTGEYR